VLVVMCALPPSLQAALLTHRTPVLPDLPCESWWLHQAKWSKLDGNKTGSGRECEPPVLVNEGRYWWGGGPG
jgi:hypothetical protein